LLSNQHIRGQIGNNAIAEYRMGNGRFATETNDNITEDRRVLPGAMNLITDIINEDFNALLTQARNQILFANPFIVLN
jgi:hypothetical protein